MTAKAPEKAWKPDPYEYRDYSIIPLPPTTDSEGTVHHKQVRIYAQVYKGRLFCHIREFWWLQEAGEPAPKGTPDWKPGNGFSFRPVVRGEDGVGRETIPLVAEAFRLMAADWAEGMLEDERSRKEIT